MSKKKNLIRAKLLSPEDLVSSLNSTVAFCRVPIDSNVRIEKTSANDKSLDGQDF